MTNMMNLEFTLLIIFIITTPLIQQEQTIPLNLPNENKKPQTPPKDNFQTISIDQNSHVYVDNKHITFAKLDKTLDEFATRPKPPIIHLRDNITLQYQQIVRIMNELMKHNLMHISLDTESK
jgi:Biopolymer transport protein